MYSYCVHDCKWHCGFDVQRVWETSTVKILLTSREIPHLHNVYTDGPLLFLLHEKPFCTILHSATHHQLRQTSKAHRVITKERKIDILSNFYLPYLFISYIV